MWHHNLVVFVETREIEGIYPMNTETVFKCDCDVCGKTVHFGPHRYGGRRNSTYQIIVCDSCRVGNHDGWAPHLE